MREAVTALFLCLMLAFAGASSPLAAQPGQGGRSPFGAGSPPPATVVPSAAPTEGAGPWSRFWTWAESTQRQLHRSIAKNISALSKEHGIDAGLLLVVLSFGYGVLHALGPGHGKAVISSYTVANERTVRRGVALSFAAALAQALTAIAIAAALVLGLKATSVEIQSTVGRLESASYALIALTGAWLFHGAARRAWFRPPKSRPAENCEHGPGHEPGHSHDYGVACESVEKAETCSCGHAHMPHPAAISGELTPWRAVAIVFAVGIRPCTGALLALVFALQQGIFYAGVLAVLAMSLGTAITVSTLVTLAVGSREAVVGASGRNGAWAGRIYDFAAVSGSLLLVAMGVTLFIASLGPARPFL
jgi:nickel/cobalt exporter